ncbi:anti-sigma factor domain-containing protein [Aquipuribacter hungaricus]|uniref:Regulator of SigK n=2 Tax=Aquipuribacter hungaricus TaxID=545624 RepID=A0ABV7WGU8_9MICO
MRPDAHTLVAAYAVHALDEGERTEVREHLEQCETCRDDLRAFRETAATLATAAAEAPPARMRAAVMARVRSTPQLPPLTDDPDASVEAPSGGARPDAVVTDPSDPVDPVDPAGPPGSSPGVPGEVGTGARAVPAARRQGREAAGSRRAPSRALFGLAASALTVAALGAGTVAVVQSDRLGDAQVQQAAVQRVLSADDVVTLSGPPTLADGVQGDDEVVVLASPSRDAALILPAGLPAAPEGSTWQAWTVTGEQATSAGTFDVGDGEAVALQASVAGADAVAVSLEPAGGSEAPTTDPVLVLPLA